MIEPLDPVQWNGKTRSQKSRRFTPIVQYVNNTLNLLKIVDISLTVSD